MAQMANDNATSVVSISFGGCEQNRNFNTFIVPENTIFEQMAAQGMSVFAASGDSGSRDCLLHHTGSANSLAVDDPASQPYVTGVEGYPGLIVHGPLIATLLMDLVRRNAPNADVAAFRFKAVRPTFDLNPFRVSGEPQADGKTLKLWAQDHEGWLTMDAIVTLR